MRKIIDKITDWLVKWGIDVYIHIICVMCVALVVTDACLICGAGSIQSGCIGAFVGLIAGFLKEVYDKKTTGIFDAKDLVADLIGAVLFLLIFI